MPPPPPIIPAGMRPPDGGFGWIVAAAYALNNAIVLPIIQNFGLIFRELFDQLHLSGTDVAVIMNTSNAFGLIIGLFNGPILKRFSYRQVAIVGSLLIFSGVALTAFAHSFIEFLVFYGIIMSAGSGLAMSSFTYAVNSYFQKRRAMAMGFAMTVTGLGPVFMPHLISLSMYEFGARNTALLLAGLSLHSFMGALLLQPVRWHLLPKEPDGKDADDKDKSVAKEMVEFPSNKPAAGRQDQKGNPVDEGAKEDDEKRKKSNVVEEEDDEVHSSAPMLQRRGSSGDQRDCRRLGGDGGAGPTLWASMASINSEGLGGSFLEEQSGKKAANGLRHGTEPPPEQDQPCLLRRWMSVVVDFFDLDLLSDPVYVNLMLGLSFAVFAEVNFSLLTPFILGDRHFSTQQIATLVSIIAVADICFRFLAPFVKKVVKQPVRVMYLLGLSLLITTRSVLIFSYSYEALIGVMLALGVAKGLRTVYWVLVIPEYVPIERLPSASGLQSVTNGLLFMALGPLIGVIRDSFGNYNSVIVAVNCMTALTIIMWSAEFAILAVLRKRRSARDTDLEKDAVTESKMVAGSS